MNAACRSVVSHSNISVEKVAYVDLVSIHSCILVLMNDFILPVILLMLP